MQVKDAMTQDVEMASPTQTIRQAALLMAKLDAQAKELEGAPSGDGVRWNTAKKEDRDAAHAVRFSTADRCHPRPSDA